MYCGNSLNIHEYIIDSFLKGNLKNCILKDVDCKDDIDIQKEQSKFKDIIIIINELKGLLSEITEENYDILICNSDGFVIDTIHMGNSCCGKTKGLEVGMWLGQNKYGESAVSLSIVLGRPVNLPPTHNRNRFFIDCYEYCLPLAKNEDICAYLCIIANNSQNIIDTLLFDIAHFIKFNVCYKYRNNDRISDKNDSSTDPKLLSSRQIDVLVRMAKGLTEYATSKELGICKATVKFHKQMIFEKLNANCTIDAVVKAIKKHYITLDDI